MLHTTRRQQPLFPEELSAQYSEDIFPFNDTRVESPTDSTTYSDHNHVVLSSPHGSVGSPTSLDFLFPHDDSMDFFSPLPDSNTLWGHVELPTNNTQTNHGNVVIKEEQPRLDVTTQTNLTSFPFNPINQVPLYNISNMPPSAGSAPAIVKQSKQSKFEPEDPVAAKRGRKRARYTPLPPQPKTLTLNREQLVSISSEEYESLVKSVLSQRSLTSAEKEEVKRQRRLIKNRESAQASRSRKKQHISTLEGRVENLQHGNASLKEKYASLVTENRLLKSEVAFLTNLMNCIKVSS